MRKKDGVKRDPSFFTMQITFEAQSACTLERWRELLAHRELARLLYRIETDRQLRTLS